MRKVLLGAGLTLLLLFLSAAALTLLGLLPVSADGNHSSLEAKVMPAVLHAAVTRHASNEKNPVEATDVNLKAGTRIYKTMCATCHGTTTTASEYGQAFYPPAPRFSSGLPQYRDAELFWIVKHGIRNTGMPAWGRMLSDEEIWQVVIALKSDQNH
jgi:mono/diheme cytochrome c family protein